MNKHRSEPTTPRKNGFWAVTSTVVYYAARIYNLFRDGQWR